MKDGGLKPNPTQTQRVLNALRDAHGGWVDGMRFLRMDKPITQYHARIFELQQQGYEIEGRFVTEKNWKEYRLVKEPDPMPKTERQSIQTSLFNVSQSIYGH